MDFLKGESLDLNSNYNFWRFAEVQELNRHTVETTRAEFVFEDGESKVQENALNKHRNSISIYNTVERLNKYSSLFINYLRRLAEAKGIKFEVQAKPEGKTTTKKKQSKRKIEQIMKAKDLAPEEYERLRLRRKISKLQHQRTSKLKNSIGDSFSQREA